LNVTCGVAASSVALLLLAALKLLPAVSVTTIDAVMVPSARLDRLTVVSPLALTVSVTVLPLTSLKVITAVSSVSSPPTVKCTAVDSALLLLAPPTSVSLNDSVGCSPMS
jgi:hypothetical protein